MIDLLLSKEFKVLEPLWMMIMKSPDLLPVMWKMFPDHDMLLRAEWTTYDYFRDNHLLIRNLLSS